MKPIARGVAIVGASAVVVLLYGCIIGSGADRAVYRMKAAITHKQPPGHDDVIAESHDFAEDLMELYDTDRDGRLETLELYDRGAHGLLSYDIDGNGTVEWDELVDGAIEDDLDALDYEYEQGWRSSRNAELYRVLDLDGDDMLTANETPDILWASIVAADTNKDHRVSRAELDEADRKVGDKRRKRFARHE